MNRRKRAGQEPAVKSPLGRLKDLYNRLSRVQLLGVAILVAGFILILLLRGETPQPPPPSSVPSKTQPVNAGEQAASAPKVVARKSNHPPVITAVRLAPNIVLPGVTVHAEVKADDPDQDEISYDYAWKINGEVVAEQTSVKFDTTSLHKGDLLTVTVIPDDGKELGAPLDSNGILIQNRPPEITSLPSAGVSSGHFSYQVIAKDPDNDPLLFSLEEAPPGMTINPEGLIQWNVPRGLQGKQQVRLIASDGSASSFQAFNLNLGAGAAQ